MNNSIPITRFCFIRIGDIPKTGKSRIHRGDELIGEESGVSVWEAIELNGKYRILIPNPCSADAMGDIDSTFLRSHYYLSKPVYEVDGDVIGTGSDGEPLLINLRNIKKLADNIEDVFPHELVP